MYILYKIMFYFSLLVFGVCMGSFTDYNEAILGMIASAVLAYLCAKEIEEMDIERENEKVVVFIPDNDK